VRAVTCFVSVVSALVIRYVRTAVSVYRLKENWMINIRGLHIFNVGLYQAFVQIDP
jgi:hypothetical protein